MARSVTGRTRATASAVLLEETKSALVPATLAMLVNEPSALGVTVMETVAVAEAGRLPKSQVTRPLLNEQLPWEALTETNVGPAGSVFVKTTPVAVAGPRLVRVT